MGNSVSELPPDAERTTDAIDEAIAAVEAPAVAPPRVITGSFFADGSVNFNVSPNTGIADASVMIQLLAHHVDKMLDAQERAQAAPPNGGIVRAQSVPEDIRDRLRKGN